MALAGLEGKDTDLPSVKRMLAALSRLGEELAEEKDP